jgi:hypothetical protein
MLLLCVPKPYRDEARLRKLYGDSAKRIFIPRTTKELINLVKEREETAMRLEKAEIALIKKANAARNKYYRKHPQSAGVRRWFTTGREIRTFNGQNIEDGKDVSSHNEMSTVDSGETVRRSNEPREAVLSDIQFVPDIEIQDNVNNAEGGKNVTNHEEEEEIKAEDLDYVHPYGLGDDLPDVRGSVAATPSTHR